MTKKLTKFQIETIKTVFVLVVVAFIGFKYFTSDEDEKLMGLAEFNQMVSTISPNSKYYLYNSSRDIYEKKFYKSGSLGKAIYGCIENSTARLYSVPANLEKAHLEVVTAKERFYFELKFQSNEIIRYATFMSRDKGEYGFRVIRFLKLDCLMSELE